MALIIMHILTLCFYAFSSALQIEALKMGDQPGPQSDVRQVTQVSKAELMAEMKTMLEQSLSSFQASLPQTKQTVDVEEHSYSSAPDDYYGHEEEVQGEYEDGQYGYYPDEDYYQVDTVTPSTSTAKTPKTTATLEEILQRGSLMQEETHTNSPDNILSGIIQSMNTEDTSQKLDDALAEVCTILTTNGLSEVALNEIQDKYLPPQNCASLTSVKVNPIIWQLMTPNVRSQDIKLQKIQTLSAKTLMALASAMDDVKTAAVVTPCLNNTFRKLADVFALAAAQNRERNLRRRELIKNDLNPAYRHICAPTVPITDMLFGNDLDDLIKHQTEANKMRQQVANLRGGRGRYQRGNNRGRVSKPRGNFRGRGAPRGRGYNSDSNQVFGRGRGQSRGRGRAQRGANKDQ